MKTRCLVSLLCVLSLPLLAATGDIRKVTIGSDGWTAYVDIIGLSTGGTHAMGLGPNRTISGNEKLVITATSSSYDTSGNSTTVVRTLVGTKIVRIAGTVNQDVQAASGDVTNRYALSAYVYASDTSVTATVASGLYTQAATPNNSFSGAATNLSTLQYPKVVGNWTCVPYQMLTNTLTLRFVAFHPSAFNGLPVQCVTFTAKDQHSHTATVTTNQWTVDRTQGDALPFGELIGVLDVSGFTQGDLVTCDFKAFPRVGDSTAVLDTSVAPTFFPTAEPCTQTNFCDNAGTFGAVYAIVEPGVGSDSTGLAANNASWGGNNNPAHFATIGGAMKACYGTNAFYGSTAHQNIGNCFILCSNGLYASLGITVSAPAQGNTNMWCHIIAQSTGAYITNQAGTERLINDQDRLHIKNFNFTGSLSTGVYFHQHVWMDHCNIQWTGAQFFTAGSSVVNCWYITQGVVSNLTQGVYAPSGQTVIPVLVRGVDMTDFGKKIDPRTFVGNVHRATDLGATAQFVVDAPSAVWPTNYWSIVYNNAFYGLGQGGTANAFQAAVASQTTNGYCIIQNVLDSGTNRSNTGVTFDLGSNNNFNYTNAMIWNNVILIGRTFDSYNDTGTAAAYHVLGSDYNNVRADYNIKGDNYASGSGTNAARIGGWADMWGVNHYGSIDLCTTNVGAYDSFDNEDIVGTYNNGFEGINCMSYHIDIAAGSGTNYPQYVTSPDYQTTESQNLDYRYTSPSPLLSTTYQLTKQVLPFDILGNIRNGNDPPGPFAYSRPKDSRMFFGN